MNPAPSGARPRRLAFLLCLPLLAAMVGVWVWVASLRDRKWSEMLARMELLHAEPAPPLPVHLSLGRTQLPGNAWDDYSLANPQTPGRPPATIIPVITPFLQRNRTNRVEVESLLDRFSGSIDLLSSGARRLEARPPQTPNHDGGNLNSLCVAKARFLAEAGRIPDALDLLADGCVHGCDIARAPELSDLGKSLLRSTFREIRDVLQRRDVAREDLLTLERRLEALEAQFPGFGRDLEDGLVKLGNLLIREDRDDRIYLSFSQGRARRSWRFFYSSRLQAATAFLTADTIVRRVQEARALPWPEQKKVLQEVLRDTQENPLIDYHLTHAQDLWHHHQTLAALRLLRLAAHYRATGEILKLADPLGGMLETAESDGTLTAWGRLPHGSGVWTAKKGEGDYTATWVITVRKP